MTTSTEPIVQIEFSYEDDDQGGAARNAVDTVLSNLALNGNSLFTSNLTGGQGEFWIQVEDEDSANIVATVMGSFLGFMVDNVEITIRG
jgi:hypothetical protein